jgi:hypothetical protein
LHYLKDVSVAEKASLGFQASDVILDCQFAGVTCTLRDFTHFYDATLGNCYSFNSHSNTNTTTTTDTDAHLYTTTLTGRQYGLQLILAVNQHDYVTSDSNVAGIRVAVTSQGEMAFPADNGLTLRPGQTTLIGLNKARDLYVL